jgi:SLA1 homology domain 1, SHD1
MRFVWLSSTAERWAAVLLCLLNWSLAEKVASQPPGLAATYDAAASLEIRIWSDSTGKHSVQSTLIEAHGDNVYLQRLDGKIIAVPVSRLSDANRKYVDSQHMDYILTGPVVEVTDGDELTMLEQESSGGALACEVRSSAN